ncbi:hypothetical protein [Streptomyces sp. NPDC057545]|uniref:hypothetical protein n=1 Tax=unclassified Streptomyces TaxID=2593676 RepID=UPI00367D1E62
MLTLVAMGKGVLPVGDHSRSYYPRPDVAHVPLRDAQPIERGPVWLVPGAWDPFAAAEQAWLTGGDAPVRCTHCRAESPLTEWTGMDNAFAYGSPRLHLLGMARPDPRVLAEFGLRLDKHRTACVRGKI